MTSNQVQGIRYKYLVPYMYALFDLVSQIFICFATISRF